MEELNLTTIYWLISIGLFVGMVIDIIMIKRGVGLVPNIIGGAVGSLIIGGSMIILNVFAPLIYAAVGTIAFLFLINVFSFEEKHTSDVEAG